MLAGDVGNGNQSNPGIEAVKDKGAVCFKIQISSASNPIPLNSEHFKGLKGVEEIQQFGLYKYAVGNEANFDGILKLKEKIKLDFPDAFVIALKGGEIIPLNQALDETKKGN